MSPHPDELELYDFVLGVCAEITRASVERHAAECPQCAADLRAIEESLSLLGASIQPEPAPLSVRARVLKSTNTESLADKFARVFDLARDKAEWLIAQIGAPRREGDGWRPGPMPGMELFDFKAGPRLVGADTGLVRFPPNMTFPKHSHLGRETMLVLQGGFTTDDGKHVGPGDELTMEEGSAHEMLIDGDGCVSAVSLRVGIYVEGVGPITVKNF
jgi:putative transcriptional regulator